MTRIPYKTLLKRGSDSFVVNKSRFIGHGVPIQSEQEALDILARVRLEYADASHNCFAYIVGANMGIMRYSDDGEPSGTAGLPIIQVMKAREVTNALVVVTRYFGGVLLGAGGLVRAYSQGAASAIDAAGVGVIHPTVRYLMDVDYPQLARMEHFLSGEPVLIEDKAFAEIVTLTWIAKCEHEAELVDRIIDISNGQVAPIRFEEFDRAWEEPPPQIT